MKSKLLASLLFAVMAAVTSFTFAASAPADSHQQGSSFPVTPVGSPFIE